MGIFRCISPIDGSIYAERETLSPVAARAAIAQTRHAQKAWGRPPARRSATGAVCMDRCDDLDPALCWTGCKDTGRGGSLSVLGCANLTRPKSYHLKKA